MKTLAFVCFILLLSELSAQQYTLRGAVLDELEQPVSAVNILLGSDRTVGTISNAKGEFELLLAEGAHTLTFSHVQFENQEIGVQVPQQREIKVYLIAAKTLLDEVEVEGQLKKDDEIVNPSRIDAQAAQNLPSAFGDFSKVLLTLPGVAANNELSSSYNVRGGNFDENLVYVNDIPVYRPFLSNAGRQEGLSFVNPSLVNDITFYAGGWEAKYGDKLSSSLNIDYKEPSALEGELTFGLLGGTAYLGNQLSEDVKYLFGARHRDSRYLLGTLETQGQYLPTYTDVQALLTFDLSQEGQAINRTKLNWLLSYGRNRYLTIPESQTTIFGSFSQNLRIDTDFSGRDELNYDTYQTGVNLSHRWSNKFLSRWIGSVAYTSEQERYEVQGYYRLCDVDNSSESNGINECAVVRGIGGNYDYGRNELTANIATAEWRNELLIQDKVLTEFGVGWNASDIKDAINEYIFQDSAGFASLRESTFNELDLTASTYTAFAQTSFYSSDSVHGFNVGVRFNAYTYNNQSFLSPRIIYRFKPNWERETSFRVSFGRYSQQPFYRELRDSSGELVNDLQAQDSWHAIASADRILEWWGRDFLLTIEGYYKSLSNVIAYDIDNLRLRYFANNEAKAFASGIDLRLNGEFIPGAQSWFSLGILNTQEDISEDTGGYIRRPLDQRINLAFYFEDHLPNDPTTRVYVNTVFGSGYPTGPPNFIDLRNSYSGDEYYRSDIGFSKSFNIRHKYFTQLWLRAEILNVFAADNTLSYTWIQDVTGSYISIPNSLSARFLNLKISGHF